MKKISFDPKLKLLIYAVISAISFSYLIMPQNASISVPIFTFIQFIMLLFIIPQKKRMIFFIPLFILSVNSFISANHIWHTSNIIISAILYISLIVEFNFKSDSIVYLQDICKKFAFVFSCYKLPFKWSIEITTHKVPVLKRIAAALILTIPCGIILVMILANADMVFSLKTESFIGEAANLINPHFIFIMLCGIVAGLFLFGITYHMYEPCKTNIDTKIRFKGDHLIINTFISAISIVYTLFAVVQFKYLFAGSALPEGLTYTEYARKGFFELLALTGVNIGIILVVISLTKETNKKWTCVTKALCHYLCAMTVILLASSFYRMFLYINSDGLTRLRLFVIGFLAFEAIGLAATFFYIAKPKFNITLIYLCVALTYYSILNLVPVDTIIAKEQINRFLCGQRENIYYVFMLSPDAASSVKYLYDNTTDPKIAEACRCYLEDAVLSEIPDRWQRYNLATETAKNILTNK